MGWGWELGWGRGRKHGLSVEPLRPLVDVAVASAAYSTCCLVYGLGTECGPSMQPELCKELRVLVKCGVRSGEELVSREDGVGTSHEHDGLWGGVGAGWGGGWDGRFIL